MQAILRGWADVVRGLSVAAVADDNYSCRCGDPASAHKHGVFDDDIRHAINNVIGSITRPDQPDFTMLIGPDSKSALIEVGILETDDQDYVIHAMPARDRYLTMIDPRRGDSR